MSLARRIFAQGPREALVFIGEIENILRDVSYDVQVDADRIDDLIYRKGAFQEDDWNIARSRLHSVVSALGPVIQICSEEDRREDAVPALLFALTKLRDDLRDGSVQETCRLEVRVLGSEARSAASRLREARRVFVKELSDRDDFSRIAAVLVCGDLPIVSAILLGRASQAGCRILRVGGTPDLALDASEFQDPVLAYDAIMQDIEARAQMADMLSEGHDRDYLAHALKQARDAGPALRAEFLEVACRNILEASTARLNEMYIKVEQLATRMRQADVPPKLRRELFDIFANGDASPEGMEITRHVQGKQRRIEALEERLRGLEDRLDGSDPEFSAE